MMNAPDLVPVLNLNPLLDNLVGFFVFICCHINHQQGDIIDKLGIDADRNCLNQLNAILVEIRRRLRDNFIELPTDHLRYKEGTENDLQKIHRKVINICATDFGVFANVHDIELFSRANTEAVNVVAVTLLSLLKYIVQNLTAEKDGALKNIFDQEKHKKANLMIEKWLQERQPKYKWSRYDDKENESTPDPVLESYEREIKSSRKLLEKYKIENETLKVSAKSSNEQMTTQIKKLEQEIQDLKSDSETWKSVEECYKTMIQDLEGENESLKVAANSTAIKELKKIGKEYETKIEQLEEELIIERELANQKSKELSKNLDERQRFFDQKLMDLNLIVERKDAMIANLEKDLKAEQEFAKQNFDDILKKSSEYDEVQKDFEEKLEKSDAMILTLIENLNLKETENIERHSAWEKILITLEEYETRIHEFESKLTDFEIVQKKMVEAEEAQKIFEEKLHEKDNMILKLKEDSILKENENVEVQNRLFELKKESQLATDDLEKMYMMVKEYKTKILQFEQDFKEIQKKITKSDEARKIAENELQTMKDAAKSSAEQLDTRIKTLEDENENLKVATSSELENLATEIKQFKEIQEENEIKILELEDELKTEREMTKQNLDEFQKKIVESDEARKIAQNELQTMKDSAKSLAEQLTTRTTEIKQFEKIQKENETKIMELEDELKTEREMVIQNLDEFQKKIVESDEARKIAQNELQGLNLDVEEKEYKISELEIELKTKLDEYSQNIMGCEEELERVLARENELKEELENVKIVVGEKETKISELENGLQHDKNDAEVELKAAKEKLVETSKTWKMTEERLMKSITDLTTENETLNNAAKSSTEQFTIKMKSLEIENETLKVATKSSTEELITQIINLEQEIEVLKLDSETWKLTEEHLTAMISDLTTENEVLKVVPNSTIPSLALENLDDTASEADSGIGNSARTPRHVEIGNEMTPRIRQKKTNYLAWFFGTVLVVFGSLFSMVYKVIGKEVVNIPIIGRIEKNVYYNQLPPQ